jgi:hypothetical protein
MKGPLSPFVHMLWLHLFELCVVAWNREPLKESRAMFPLIFFTAARTCYCCEQKNFTRPDDGAAL